MKKISIKKEHMRVGIFFLEIISLFLIFAWITRDSRLFVDEGDYYYSISQIVHKQKIMQALTFSPVLPGFVIMFSFFMKIFGSYSLAFARTISTVFAFFSIILFFLIAKKTTSRFVFIKTLQYALSPLFFPFFFLVYTDIVSLFFVLLSFLLLLNKKYTFSGIIAFLSLFIRQDNIFWIGFFLIYSFKDDLPFNSFKERILYILSFVFLGLLFLINGNNIALGDKKHHIVSFHTGNIYLFFFLLFLLFFPLHIYHLKKIFLFIKNHLWTFLIVLLFSISFFFLKIDHKYNQSSLGLFLHNQLFHLLLLNTQNKIIGYIILVWTILSCMVTQFVRKKMYAVYFFSILAFAFHWLIDPRYIFPAIAFFILFKKEESLIIESCTLFFSALMMIVVVLGIQMRIFFP